VAKKAAKKSRSTKSKPARRAKSPSRAAKASTTAKPAGKSAAKEPKRPAARASKRTGGARAAGAAARRALKPRSQPETLRCKPFSVALTADDVERSLKFWVDGVGFHVKQRWEQDGKLLGAELIAGACEIGVSQDDWGKGRDRKKGVGISLYAETTQSVDALAERLRSRNVDYRGPETNPWGWRQVVLTDPDGFRLTVYEEKKG